MKNTRYNGWTNYATWRINLEIIDDMDYYFIRTHGRNLEDLRNAMEDYVTEYIEETTEKGLARDYALAFLQDVNYREIAQHQIHEYNEWHCRSCEEEVMEEYCEKCKQTI